MDFDVQNLRGRRADQEWNRVAVGDVLERPAISIPDKTAIVAMPGAHEGRGTARFSYREADELANKVAAGIQGSGLKAGDICLMVCSNSAEALVIKLGVAKAGVTIAPLNPSLDPEVILEVITRIEPKAAVVDLEFVPKIAGILESLGIPIICEVQISSDGSGDSSVKTEGPSFRDFTDRYKPNKPVVKIHGDDIWQLLFTSGSTSAPKASMVSHVNTYMAAAGWFGSSARGLRTEHDLVCGVSLPAIYHVGDTRLYSTFMVGGTVAIAREADPQITAQMISQEQVNNFFGGMPHFLRAVADVFDARDDLTASSLKTIVYGWAPLDTELYYRYQDLVGEEVFFCAIIGQTEVVTAHRFWVNEHLALFEKTAPKINYIGLPHPLLGAQIISEDGHLVLKDEDGVGEAVYRSPALSPGYYRDEAATAAALEGGWFHSGDAFSIGEDNQRIMVDRIKDVIKTGGENVSSIRVEAALETHPEVSRAAVVGRADSRWGEAVTAVVIAAPDSSPTEEELITHSKKQLAGFEVPKRVYFVENLPTSVGGKLQKFKINRLLDELT